MNLQENIRRILKEETNYLRMLLRRLPQDTIKKMDEEFEESLYHTLKLTLNITDPTEIPIDTFIRFVIVDFIRSLKVDNYLPEELPYLDWREAIIDDLSKHYQKRITSKYDKLILKR